MENSKYYNFNLPSRDVVDEADINKLSENFEEIDRVLGEDVVRKIDVLQLFDPNSREPISSAAVSDGMDNAIRFAAPSIEFVSKVFDGVYFVADELHRLENMSADHDRTLTSTNVRIDRVESDLYVKTEWQTILDYTVPEDKGGATSLLITIYSDTLLATAKKIRVFISFPVTKSWSNNAFTLTAYICDKEKKNYRIPVLRESNVASSTNATFVASSYVDISDFSIENGYRTYCATSPKPNNYFNAPVNSFATSRLLSGGYPSEKILTYTPHLEIVPTSNTITFEKGTRVFVEVQQ